MTSGGAPDGVRKPSDARDRVDRDRIDRTERERDRDWKREQPPLPRERDRDRDRDALPRVARPPPDNQNSNIGGSGDVAQDLSNGSSLRSRIGERERESAGRALPPSSSASGDRKPLDDDNRSDGGRKRTLAGSYIPLLFMYSPHIVSILPLDRERDAPPDPVGNLGGGDPASHVPKRPRINRNRYGDGSALAKKLLPIDPQARAVRKD